MKNWIAFFIVLAGLSAQAQTVKNFSLTNVVTGKTVSLETYPTCEGLLIIFTGNACPYDEYYRKRIARLAADYQDKVPVLLVNSHNDPAESAENMTKKAQQSGSTIPYLADKEQILMNALGATKSPSVYLLKNNGGEFTIVYRGAIDDNAQVEADVQHHYLKDAIDIMLSNQTIETSEIRPVGCTIKKK